MIWPMCWRSSRTTPWTQATACAVPAALNGIIQQPGDVDHYQFAAKKGETYDVRVYARQPLRSPLDSVLDDRAFQRSRRGRQRR